MHSPDGPTVGSNTESTNVVAANCSSVFTLYKPKRSRDDGASAGGGSLRGGAEIVSFQTAQVTGNLRSLEEGNNQAPMRYGLSCCNRAQSDKLTLCLSYSNIPRRKQCMCGPNLKAIVQLFCY